MIDLFEHITELFSSTDVEMKAGGLHTEDCVRTLRDPHEAADAFIAASPKAQESIRATALEARKVAVEKALLAPRVGPKQKRVRIRVSRSLRLRLTAADDLEIVRMWADGVPLSGIIKRFQVSRSTIQLRTSGMPRRNVRVYTKRAAA